MNITALFKIKPGELYQERTTARNFSLSLAAVSLINMLRWYSHFSMCLTWALSLFIAFGLFYFCIQYKTKKPSVYTFLFWICFVTAAAAITQANLYLLRFDPLFRPFGGFKLLAFAVAILAPIPFRNGYIAILLCFLVPATLFWTALADIQNQIPVQEPGITFVACVIAAFGFSYRIRGIKVETENARLRTEKENLHEFARIMLVVRDLTNTPLQVIVLTNDLLKAGLIDVEQATNKISTAVEKLTQISQVLSYYRFSEADDEKMRELYNLPNPLEYLDKRLKELEMKNNIQPAIRQTT